MILNDVQLRALGPHLLTPFEPENVQPASIDLRLSEQFRVFENVRVAVDLKVPDSYQDITRLIASPDGFVLHPGEFALGSTLEVVTMPDDLVARIEGKSSLGRLGLIVHATAGFVDPGFNGPLTLEMTNLLRVPIVLHPNILICQLGFETMVAPAEQPYQGRYQNAQGAEGSRYSPTAQSNDF